MTATLEGPGDRLTRRTEDLMPAPDDPQAGLSRTVSPAQAAPAPTGQTDAPTAPQAPPAAMAPEQAAWVRANAWTEEMRSIFREVPGHYLVCACESHWGPCSGKLPRHDTCHIGLPLPSYETLIHWPDGRIAALPSPYQYPTADATGWKRSRSAMVWLADRRCAWWCLCTCGHPRVPNHALARHPG